MKLGLRTAAVEAGTETAPHLDLGAMSQADWDQLDSAVKEITDKLVKKSPVALRLGRDSFYRQQDMEFRAALDYLHSQFTLVTLTEDSKEGIKAFFEKREPDFKGK